MHSGYEETKMSDVAKEASVSIGTIYALFENKDGVFKACLFQEISAHIEQIKKEIESVEGAREKLIKIVAHKFASMEFHRDAINDLLFATPWFFSKLIMTDPYDEILQVLTTVFQDLDKEIGLKNRNYSLLAINFKYFSEGYVMHAMKQQEKIEADPKDVVDEFLYGVTQ